MSGTNSSSKKAVDVFVYIYDISKGLARNMSSALLGKQIDGIWHTGIVVHGLEWFFGGEGIANCAPCGTVLGEPEEKKFLGTTEVSYGDFYAYLATLSRTRYRPRDYHLFNHNCNTFSNEVAQFLTGASIPAHITALPDEVLRTPFGQMIKPMMEQMSVDPGRGHHVHFGGGGSSRDSNSTAVSASSSSSASSKNVSNGPPTPPSKSVEVSPSDVADASASLKAFVDASGGNSAESSLVEDIREYSSLPLSSAPDWSLGRSHLNFLVDLALNQSTITTTTSGAAPAPPCQQASDLLAHLCRRDEVAAMMQKDPRRNAEKMIIEGAGEGGDRLVKVLANLTAHSGHRGRMLSDEPLGGGGGGTTGREAMGKLLNRVVEESLPPLPLLHFSVLAYNAASGLQQQQQQQQSSATDDSALDGLVLELATPLLEFLARVQASPATTSAASSTVVNVVQTLTILTGLNEDVAMLAASYGVDADAVAKKAPEVAEEAKRLFAI